MVKHNIDKSEIRNINSEHYSQRRRYQLYSREAKRKCLNNMHENRYSKLWLIERICQYSHS